MLGQQPTSSSSLAVSWAFPVLFVTCPSRGFLSSLVTADVWKDSETGFVLLVSTELVAIWIESIP